MNDLYNSLYDFDSERRNGEVNITGYVRTALDTFRERPFGEVDSLVLSQLCYINFEDVLPKCPDRFLCPLQSLYRTEDFNALLSRTRTPDLNLQLLKAVCASPRFRDVKIGFIEEHIDLAGDKREQFFAASFLLPSGEVFVGFRGTDASLAGWKEDLDMIFTEVTPGQKRAKEYIERNSHFFDGDIFLGGHSKGGSLGMFRYAFCKDSVARRIKGVYNLDGPGLSKNIKELPWYRDTSAVTHTTLPSASVIGVIFIESNYTAVKSEAIGPLTHDPFSWMISGKNFVTYRELTKGSERLSKATEEMMAQLTREERALVIDSVFEVIEATGEEDVTNLATAVLKNPRKIYEATRGLPQGTAVKVAKLSLQILKIIAEAVLPSPAAALKTRKSKEEASAG